MKHNVISLEGRIIQCCKNILALQKRIVSQNLFEGSACGQQFQNVSYSQTVPANTRAAAALSSFNCNSLEALWLHRLIVTHPCFFPKENYYTALAQITCFTRSSTHLSSASSNSSRLEYGPGW